MEIGYDTNVVCHIYGQNFKVQTYGDLIVRDCYWIWKSHGSQGNTIDFFIQVQKLSFAQAMNQILSQ